MAHSVTFSCLQSFVVVETQRGFFFLCANPLTAAFAERGGTATSFHPQRVPAEEDEGKTTPEGPQQ